MAIVATKDGSLVPCAGGEHRFPNGQGAVKALPWRHVELIGNKFQRLNPYNPKFVKELLKIEDCNYEKRSIKMAKKLEVRGISYTV